MFFVFILVRRFKPTAILYMESTLLKPSTTLFMHSSFLKLMAIFNYPSLLIRACPKVLETFGDSFGKARSLIMYFNDCIISSEFPCIHLKIYLVYHRSFYIFDKIN